MRPPGAIALPTSPSGASPTAAEAATEGATSTTEATTSAATETTAPAEAAEAAAATAAASAQDGADDSAQDCASHVLSPARSPAHRIRLPVDHHRSALTAEVHRAELALSGSIRGVGQLSRALRLRKGCGRIAVAELSRILERRMRLGEG